MQEPLCIAIAYPPLPSEKGVPLLSQNRQFQWFTRPTYIYPVVPAQAATLLQQAGFKVKWLDGIAAEQSTAEFADVLQAAQPDLIVMETKTPVIKQHWEYINQLKAKYPNLIVVLCGDHVTAMPEESFDHSQVDIVLTGGDYDFLLLDLVQNITITPTGWSLDQEAVQPGIYWRLLDGSVVNSGQFQLDHDLNTLPFIDRELTQWQLYAEKNGNFRQTPGTYIMAGRDCWHGKCTFCSWTTLYPTFRVRDPITVVDEIGELISKYKIREIMDDTGSFPAQREWLQTFCAEMIRRGYHKQVRIDCNMRFGALDAEQYALMRKAGFRLVLFGLESANQGTLNRLVKGLKTDQITEGARAAARAGLDVHITVMFGYPWEEEQEVKNTIQLARYLLRKGYASTLQVTMMVPYPGTPLFKELDEQGLLLTHDWNEYDMRQQVMHSGISEELTKKAIQKVYRGFLHPETIVRRLLTTKNIRDDLKFYWRGFRSLLGHLRDFKT